MRLRVFQGGSWRLPAFFWIAASLAGCSRLIGIDDIVYVEADGAIEERQDGSSPIQDVASDAPVENGTCNLAAVGFDDHNCGRCGHDCLGSTCKNGMCQPVFLARESGQPGSIVTSNDGYVYWVDDGDGAVRRVKKDGSGLEAIAPAGSDASYDILVDDVYAYYMIFSAYNLLGGVQRVRKDGAGDTVSLSAGIPNVRSLAMRDPYIFVSSMSDPSRLFRTSKDISDGPATVALFIGSHDAAGDRSLLAAVAADDQHVYVTDIGLKVIWRIRQDATPSDPPDTFSTHAEGSFAIGVDGDFVYWADLDHLYRKAKTEPSNDVTPLVAAIRTTSIALDASHLYYACRDDPSLLGHGVVRRIKKDGEEFATEVSGGWPLVRAIAIDGDSVYFTTADAVVKVAK